MDKELLREKISSITKEVSGLRGTVITKSLDVELFIGAIINNFFVLQDKQSTFSDFVLSDEFFQFGLKIKILHRILRCLNLEGYPEFKSDLKRFNELRNRFAHSPMFGFNGDLIYNKGEKEKGVRNSQEMYEEFMVLYPKIMKQLEEIFFKIIKSDKSESEFD